MVCIWPTSSFQYLSVIKRVLSSEETRFWHWAESYLWDDIGNKLSTRQDTGRVALDVVDTLLIAYQQTLKAAIFITTCFISVSPLSLIVTLKLYI